MIFSRHTPSLVFCQPFEPRHTDVWMLNLGRSLETSSPLCLTTAEDNQKDAKAVQINSSHSVNGMGPHGWRK